MEKKIVFIASVKEREEQLKIVLKIIYDQVDLIHLVLNWYNEIPEWIKNQSKIFAHLNPDNKNAHDSVWQYIDAENAVNEIENGGLESIKDSRALQAGNYYFILDDDLFYPADYIEKLIEAIERHERRAVITVHGSNIIRPVESYFQCRRTYGFSDALERDIFVDMAGVGVTAFHSSTIKPTLQHFPIPYCRDLWFSILCARNNVPIVSLQRPKDWIRALQTPGDTVYELSQKNENLKRIKDRILKEQLLPLLFCDPDLQNRYCLITDYDFNEQLLQKSLETLNNVADCNKIVFSNKAKNYGSNILTQYVIPEEVNIGRMGSKVLTQYRFIKGLPDNSSIISADADLYYLEDPFTAFRQDFDIAVTTRPDDYQYLINGGVVMFRVNDRVRNFLDFIMAQIFERTWLSLIKYQKQFSHEGNDWYIDQDIWNVVWLNKDWIQKQFDVKIVDIGPIYNYCPHADGVNTPYSKLKLIEAYYNKSVSVLHLKSRLKELLLDGIIK